MNKMIMIAAGLAFAVLMTVRTPAAELLTMEQAIQTAYENNPTLKSMRERERGASARFAEARSGRLPRFSISETMTRTDNPVYAFMGALNQRRFVPAMMNTINDPPITTNYNTKFSLQQALFTSGKVRHGIAAADSGRSAARLQARRARQQVRFQVISAYYGIILAKKRIAVADKALEAARAHADITENMFKNGMVVESDKLSADVRMAEIQEMKFSAENDLSLAQSALLMAMGVGQNREYDVDPEALGVADFNEDLPVSIVAAFKNRPDYEAVSLAVSAKEHMVAVARADGRPQAFVMGSYDLDNEDIIDSNGESWFVGVGVQWNVYDGGQTHSRVGQARADAQDMSWQREQMRQGIELEVRQAFYNVETAKKKLDVMQQAVDQAEESYRIVNNRYNNGLAINVQVLAAEAARTEAQMKFLAALYEYSVGLEKLRLATGTN